MAFCGRPCPVMVANHPDSNHLAAIRVARSNPSQHGAGSRHRGDRAYFLFLQHLPAKNRDCFGVWVCLAMEAEDPSPTSRKSCFSTRPGDARSCPLKAALITAMVRYTPMYFTSASSIHECH